MHSVRRNRLGWSLLLGVIAGGVAWLLLRPEAVEGSASSVSRTPGPRLVAGRPAARRAGSAPSVAASGARAERDALREIITRALGDAGDPGVAAAAAASARSRPAYGAGNLRDRTGARQAAVEYLNHDFMPLAKECIEQAQERTPNLSGMLWMDVEVVVAEDVGGVIDRAEPAANNQLLDSDLIECIRQSALSVILPKGSSSGREQFTLTLRVGAADAAQ